MNKGLFKLSVRDIVEIALFCAIAVVLDTFVKIPLGVTGGSINIAMVPIFIIALRHGPVKGFFAGGIVFGLLTAIIDGYGMATYPFDYLVPFGMAGLLVGLTSTYVHKNFLKSTLGSIISIIMISVAVALFAATRLFSSAINSVIIYEYTYKDGLVYGLTYIPLSALFSGIFLIALLPTIITVSKIKTSYISSISNTQSGIKSKVMLLLAAFGICVAAIFIIGMLQPPVYYVFEAVVVLLFLVFDIVVVLR